MSGRLALMMRSLIAAALAVLVASPVFAQTLEWRKLHPINGWETYGFYGTRAPAIAIDAGGIVHMRGAIKQTMDGGNSPFVLPQRFRPLTDVYVFATTQNATPGRLIIRPNGLVRNHGLNPDDAAVFTSLEGITFAGTGSLDWTPVTLINGWQSCACGTRDPEIAIDADGIVHMRGGMKQVSGAGETAFVLPPGFRPRADVYVLASTASASAGRLLVQRNGEVRVQAPVQANAQGFTSLEGISFGQAGTLNWRPLQLVNGWETCDCGTRVPAVAINADGIVHLRGGIKQDVNNIKFAFRLPEAFRPARQVFVAASTASASVGRLTITRKGHVYPQTANQSNARAFTSLEGISYSKP